MSVEQIRHFKNLLENIEVLEEGQNYGEMFNDLIQLETTYSGQGFDMGDKAGIDYYPKGDSVQVISACKNALRKKNIIIWFLRQWKYWYAACFMSDFSEYKYTLSQDGEVPQIIQYIDNSLKKIEKKTKNQLIRIGMSAPAMNQLFDVDGSVFNHTGSISNSYTEILNKFQHYLSLPIPEIQNYVYTSQGLGETVAYFKKVEEKWQAEAKELIPYDPKDGEIVAKFSDGFFWLKLDRAKCKIEGGAMGHCGNAASAKPDDRILSLRKIVKRGTAAYVRPSLTFILNGDGFLGEMKGRANKKPEPQYHPYIVTLLKLPIIKGIRGGGHDPKNNFALSDLDEDTRDELLSQKPQLGSLRYHYNASGLDDFLKIRIKDSLGKNYKIYSDKKTDYLVVREFKELYDLIEKYGNSGAKWTRNTLHGAEIDDSITKILPLPEHNKDVFVLKHLKEELLINLAEYAKKKFGFKYDSETLSDDRTLKKLSKIIKDNDSKFDELINDSYLEGLADGTGDNSYSKLDRVLKEDHTGTLGVEIKIVTNDYEDFAYSEEICLVVPIKEVLYIIDHPKMLNVIKDKGWLEDFKITIKLRDLEYKYLGSRANNAIEKYLKNAS